MPTLGTASEPVHDELLIAQVCPATRHAWAPDTGMTADIDQVLTEEPLEIRVGHSPLAVVMRTPGHDIELATGFTLTERILPEHSAIERVAHCTTGEHADNVINVTPASHIKLDVRKFARNLYTTSSCGICGKRSIELAMSEASPLTCWPQFNREHLTFAPANLRKQQAAFKLTGSSHAGGLLTQEGELLCVREDIGRHNAVDKVIGWGARTQVDLTALCLLVSGRLSYEIVQKALAMGISCICAVGGVSSLAIALAERSGIAVIGFTSEEKLSIYTFPERIT